MDTLQVRFSEPIADVMDTAGKVVLIRERGGSVAFKPQSINMNTSKTASIYLFNPELDGAVYEGDKVRFDPQVSRYVDASSNAPEFENPWVTVTGSSSVKVKISISMKDKVTKGGKEGYGDFEPASKEQFRITMFNQKSGKLDIWENGLLVTAGIDSSTYHFQGPVFFIDLRIPRGTAIGEAPVWDSVMVKLDCSIFSNLGGFVNREMDRITFRNGDYLDEANQVRIAVEWISHDGKAPASKDGRLIGTGAYIAKSVVSAVIKANNPKTRSDVTARYDGKKSSHSENWLFGFQRLK